MAEQEQKQPGTGVNEEQVQPAAAGAVEIDVNASSDEALQPLEGELEPLEGQLESSDEELQAADGELQPPDGEPLGLISEEGLEDLVSQLQEDLTVARDAVLRAQAEAQNSKRRAAQDVEKARKFALESFSKELLPVVDNLERALQSTSEDEAVKTVVEGVELTLKSFLGAMQKFNLEQLDPEGEPFDPNLHQAITMVENPEVEPNTVIGVMQKGYVLNGRLMRPAMVMVSKKGG